MKFIKTSAEHAWFNERRYGMFIHWGAYAVAARGEWVRNRERIPQDEYMRLYADKFRAENYDPTAWAALAKEAGMGYVVLTTRHHDGFALWPTKQDAFHAGNIGPKRDLVRPYVEAMRAAGLRVGFYYSPADWHHPDYPGAFFRDWPEISDWKSPEARERFIAYYRAQLVELMTDYGKIDYLWYDGCIPEDMQRAEVNEEMLRLQPDLLLSERNGPPAHVKICEQAIRVPNEDIPWEACMTLNDNWGWHAGDANWKTPVDVVKLLTETAAGGGNLLLNVGPKPDGTIPAVSAEILRPVGRWLQRNGEAIYRTDRSPLTWNNWGRVTVKGSSVYLHIRNRPGPELCFAELKNRVRSARWLDGGQPVAFDQKDGRLILRCGPEQLADALGSVIVLELDGRPEPLTRQTSFFIPG